MPYIQFNSTCVGAVPYYNDSGMLIQVSNCSLAQFYIVDPTGSRKCVDSCNDPLSKYQYQNPIEGRECSTTCISPFVYYTISGNEYVCSSSCPLYYLDN